MPLEYGANLELVGLVRLPFTFYVSLITHYASLITVPSSQLSLTCHQIVNKFCS